MINPKCYYPVYDPAAGVRSDQDQKLKLFADVDEVG